MSALLYDLVHDRRLVCFVLSSLTVSLFSVGLQAEDSRGNVTPGPVEAFAEGDAPRTVTIDKNDFSTPYGYNRAANADLKYPLVVVGKWSEGNKYFDTEIRKRYPAFYLSFPYDREPDGARLADLIDAALGQGLRIDVNRILYTGFSAGGSGSFRLVRGMASKGKYFAGLNRVAGQSESVLAESATGKTAIWLHQGLKDTSLRVSTSRQLYENQKNHAINAGAVETHVSDTVRDGVPRNTWILTKNGVQVVRYSEYPTCGHDAWIGYSDPYMFEWIFGRANGRDK